MTSLAGMSYCTLFDTGKRRINILRRRYPRTSEECGTTVGGTAARGEPLRKRVLLQGNSWPSTSQPTGVERTRQTVGSAPDENRFTVCEQARRVYSGAVFEIKKEIAIKMTPEGWLSNLTFSGGIS